jgi:hypothetical protein
MIAIAAREWSPLGSVASATRCSDTFEADRLGQLRKPSCALGPHTAE